MPEIPHIPTIAFGWPLLLWLLLVPALQIGWDLTRRRRQATNARPKILRAEAGAHSLKLAEFDTKAVTRTSRPRWWLCIGLVFCIVALARPQWGRLEEPVFEQAREIMLAIDLSRSMLAQDVRPTRLDRSKLLIRSLLEKLAGERVGLIVFSGTAFLQSPLSADYEILLEFLPALGPEFLPEGGTNYKALIDTALGAFASTNAADRFMIVLSDGEATDEDWKPRVAELKAKGVRVIGLGVGTTTGAMIPDDTGGFIKDERGAVVMTKLESGTLQELAQATNGVYRDASSWVDLAALLKETIEAGKKGQFVETNTIRLVERFQWPLAIGLWFLLVSFCYEFPVRPRPRDIMLRTMGSLPRPATVNPPRDKSATAVAGTAASILLFALLLAPHPLRAANMAPVDTSITPGKESQPAAALSKIVGRLSASSSPTAKDWADMGRETVAWGTRLQMGQQSLPEGPIHDAIGGVDIGEKLDPKATDWPKLREELQELLKKQDSSSQDPQEDKKQNKDKQEQQQQQDQQNQQNSSQDKNAQNEKDDKKDSEDKPQPQSQKQGDSAFGDMNKKEEPPPPPEQGQADTQKVGGGDKDEQPEPIDPSLALPLQKLDQLRNQDSPAQLFRLMEGDAKPPKKPAKDW